MHTIWKGNISFGLINIAVKLHSTVDDKDIKFKNLDKYNLAPVKQSKSSPHQDIVKGFEYETNKYVVIEDEEIEVIKKKFESRAVEVLDFIELDEIDPIYFNLSYYLSPEEGHVRAYSLLRRVLTESNKVGIAKISIRSGQQLAAIRTYKDVLVLETLHYPDEVRPVENVPNTSETVVDEKELKIAHMLIEQLTAKFEPTKYKNEYRSDMLSLINSKLVQKKESIEVISNESSSLMDILQASLRDTRSKEVFEIDVELNLTSPSKSKKKSDKKKTSV